MNSALRSTRPLRTLPAPRNRVRLLPAFRVFSISAFLFSALPFFSLPAFSQEPDPVTQLDTLVVNARTELPPPENWLVTTLPGLVIYSNASERATKRLIKDFDMFRVGLENAWPIKVAHRRPLTLILCGRGGFEDFIPKADIADLSKDSGRASATIVGPDRAYIALDMSASTMSLNNVDFDPDSTGGGATFEVDYFRLLYREYVHCLLSQTETPPPVWYEEGVLQIIQKMEVFPKYIRIGEIKSEQSGKPPNPAAPSPFAGDGDAEADDMGAPDMPLPGSDVISDTDFNVALQRRALLGFKEFFGVTRDSPLARNPIGNNVWAKQCYAFVHMCLYGMPNHNHKNALETLVARAAKEPVTEELFAECFGRSFKKFLLDLRGYIGYTSYQYTDLVIKGKERIESLPFELAPAREGESAAMKADALTLANNPGAALPTLRGAYGRGERSPFFLAAYGLAARANGQEELARRMLSQAIATGTTRADAYPAYAALLLEDAKARPAAGDGARISPAQLAQVLEPLFAARKIRPALPQTYELIASAWLASDAVPRPEHFALLTEGLSVFPGDIELVWLSARVVLRMGNAAAANALIAHGLGLSASDADRARFNALKPQVPQAAPPSQGAP